MDDTRPSHPTGISTQMLIPKNLPLKKRRTYFVETANNDADSTNIDQQYNRRSTATNGVSLGADPLQIHLPSPPLSPHYEWAKPRGTHLLTPASDCDDLSLQQVFAQQTLGISRGPYEQPCQHSSYSYTVIEEKYRRADLTIDEHFRKSLGDNYDKRIGGLLTPENLSSTSSPVERIPENPIDEHFARSLGRCWPLTEDSSSSLTASVVDDHFAKALGAKTWEKLKDKS